MSRTDVVQKVESQHLKGKLPEFQIGDVVDVHVRIKEGDKTRTQIFGGTVIRRKGSGIRETFTVRRIVAGEGVERTFPIHSPSVHDVRVRRAGKVRRAKLYYLRKRVGKATRIKERREGVGVQGAAVEGAPGKGTDEAAEDASEERES